MTVLYGVTPYTSFDYNVQEEDFVVTKKQSVFILLSEKMREDLKSQGSEKQVAMEYALWPEDSKYQLDKAEDFYWNEVILATNAKPVFLDDMEMVVSSVQLNSASSRLYNQAMSNKNHQVEYLRDYFRTLAEARYMYFIERAEKMKEKLKEIKPDLVVVSERFANYFFDSMPGFFESYCVEKQKDNKHNLEILRSENTPGAVNPFFMADNMVVERHYNAATKGRIKPGCNPDFIGTWDKKVPARGMFEMYIVESDKDHVIGEIEDVNGHSTFEGSITDQSISLNKTYDGFYSKILTKASRDHVYNGKKVGDVYEGMFKAGARHGYFSMSKF